MRPGQLASGHRLPDTAGMSPSSPSRALAPQRHEAILARIEAERAHWRQQMRHQLTIEREDARQRRAVLWAQGRAQRRREREQLRELHEEARRRSGAGGGQGGEPD